MQAETKIWDKGMVQALIVASDKALSKALWNIFQRQTAAEQSALQTIEHNGRGFTGHDAKFLSDVARRLPAYSFHMTPRQVAKVRPMMRKYWRQLLEDIETKGGSVSYKIANSPKKEIAGSPKPDSAIPPKSESAQPGAFGSW